MFGFGIAHDPFLYVVWGVLWSPAGRGGASYAARRHPGEPARMCLLPCLRRVSIVPEGRHEAASADIRSEGKEAIGWPSTRRTA